MNKTKEEIREEAILGYEHNGEEDLHMFIDGAMQQFADQEAEKEREKKARVYRKYIEQTEVSKKRWEHIQSLEKDLQESESLAERYNTLFLEMEEKYNKLVEQESLNRKLYTPPIIGNESRVEQLEKALKEKEEEIEEIKKYAKGHAMRCDEEAKEERYDYKTYFLDAVNRMTDEQMSGYYRGVSVANYAILNLLDDLEREKQSKNESNNSR